MSILQHTCEVCEGGGLAENGEDTCERCGGTGRDTARFLEEEIVGHMPASSASWSEDTLRGAVRWAVERIEQEAVDARA